MGLVAAIAGRYSSTYNAVSCGITQNGYELSHNTHAELINQTDAFASSLVDFIHQGGDVSLMFESKEYAAGAITPFYPWGSIGVMATAAAPIGRLASDVAASFVLTATANTPAAATPATLTASKSILSPSSNLRLLYTSKVRNVPIRLTVLPTDSAGTIRWFTQT